MHGTARWAGTIVGAVALLWTATAAAQHQPAQGDNELSGHMGATVGITDSTPGGFRFATEYGRKINQTLWFNAQINFSLGGDYGSCGPRAAPYPCNDHFNGESMELIAGVKFKFPSGRFLPYAKVGGGLAFSFYGGDHGATALVVRGGGGLKYFVIPRLAVGGEIVLSIGPNFIRHGGGTEAYIGLDFLGGVEFVF